MPAPHTIPRASAVFLLKLWSCMKWTKPVEGIWAFPVELTSFLAITWRELILELCCIIWNLFILFLSFVNGPSMGTYSWFSCQFSLGSINLSSSTVRVLCPPPLSFEIAWSALHWLVVSVAPQIEHMFDLGSTRSTPLRYRALVATYDELHI